MIKHAVAVRGGEKTKKDATQRPPRCEPREPREWPSYFGIRTPQASFKRYRFFKNNKQLGGSNTPLGRRPGELSTE